MGMRICALAMTLCLAMSACSGDPEPVYADPTPPASGTPTSGPTSGSTSDPPSPSATAEPTPEVEEPPELPAAARRDDAVGAEAFVRHYWAMVDYALITLDTTGLEKLVTAECIGCSGGQSFIDDIADRGGRIVGGQHSLAEFEARRLTVEGRPDLNQFIADVRIRSTPQRVLEGRREVDSYPGGISRQRLIVSRDGGGPWRVSFSGSTP